MLASLWRVDCDHVSLPQDMEELMRTDRPDWQSVMLYVSQIYKYFETWEVAAPRRQRPAAGTPQRSFHHRRSSDKLTFDPSVDPRQKVKFQRKPSVVGPVAVHVRVTGRDWDGSFRLHFSFHVASCVKQLLLSVSFAKMWLLGVHHFLFIWELPPTTLEG